MFRTSLKDGATASIVLQGARAKDNFDDIATILFQNYDNDDTTRYDMASIAMADAFGNATNNGCGELCFKTNQSGVGLVESMRLSHTGCLLLGSNLIQHAQSNNQRLIVDGDVVVQNMSVLGNITKGAGSFVIAHPDPIKRNAGMFLKHCFVESPTRGDNIYRYKVVTENKSAIIELPSYFGYLNENVQGWVSPVSVLAFGMCTISSDSNGLVAFATISVSDDGEFNVLIIGTRLTFSSPGDENLN